MFNYVLKLCVCVNLRFFWIKALRDKIIAKQICKVEGKGALNGKRASGAPGGQVGGSGGVFAGALHLYRVAVPCALLSEASIWL